MDSRCGLFDGIAVLHGQISVGSDDIPEANIDVEPNKIIFKKNEETRKGKPDCACRWERSGEGIPQDICEVEGV